MSYIRVSYLTEAKNLEQKAESVAVGMTVGSWTDLPAAKKETLQGHLGKAAGSHILSHTEDGLERGIIKVDYPVANFTYDIPSLLTTVFGKLSMDGKIKLVDIDVPESFSSHFSGPKFGIQGVRQRLNIQDRPLFMSIFKSCIGLPLNELVEQFKFQVEGGVDLVKDDEIFFPDERAPFFDRIEAYREVIQQSGREVLYAVNLTGPVTELVDKAKRAIDKGANCLLLNVLPYGFDILSELSRHPDIQVPIMAHPALAGAFYPSPDYGIAAPLILGKLMRLAGADLVLFPSPYGSVALPREEALSIATALTEEKPGLLPSFPVPSAGIHPGMVPVLSRDFGLDHIVNAGGGIHGHPDGPVAGGQAFVEAIKATQSGIPLEEYDNGPLQTAIKKWGVVK